MAAVMSDTPAFDMPPVSAGFDARGGWLLLRLMADLSLTPEQAAGIVGALAYESDGITAIQERGVAPGKSGFGWAQWTADRRANFFRWCADHNMGVTDDAANYGFLIDELKGSEAHALDRIRQTTTIDAATETTVKQFERPSDPEKETRGAIPYAKRAMIAAGHMPNIQVLPPPRNPWPPGLTPAPWPSLPPVPPPATMPPIANGAVAGGLTLLSMMLVKQAVFLFGLWHIGVPDDLQNLTVGGLVVLIGWFLHTKLAKTLKLDPG
jgi:hypothetical protein